MTELLIELWLNFSLNYGWTSHWTMAELIIELWLNFSQNYGWTSNWTMTELIIELWLNFSLNYGWTSHWTMAERIIELWLNNLQVLVIEQLRNTEWYLKSSNRGLICVRLIQHNKGTTAPQCFTQSPLCWYAFNGMSLMIASQTVIVNWLRKHMFVWSMRECFVNVPFNTCLC